MLDKLSRVWDSFISNQSQQQNRNMKLLTAKQAAQILGVDSSRVRVLIREGRLPAQKVGRDWVILEPDLELVKDRKPGRPKKQKGEYGC